MWPVACRHHSLIDSLSTDAMHDAAAVLMHKSGCQGLHHRLKCQISQGRKRTWQVACRHQTQTRWPKTAMLIPKSHQTQHHSGMIMAKIRSRALVPEARRWGALGMGCCRLNLVIKDQIDSMRLPRSFRYSGVQPDAASFQQDPCQRSGLIPINLMIKSLGASGEILGCSQRFWATSLGVVGTHNPRCRTRTPRSSPGRSRTSGHLSPAPQWVSRGL